MKGSDKKESKKQKIKEEKPKRQKNDQDKQFNEDLKLLTRLKQENDEMQKVVQIMEKRVQQKEQVQALTEHLKTLQKALIDVKMLETVLDQRDILQREVNQEQESEGFQYAVLSVRINLGFDGENVFYDDFLDHFEYEIDSHSQMDERLVSQNSNNFQEGSTINEARRYDNQDYSRDQESQSNSSDSN